MQDFEKHLREISETREEKRNNLCQQAEGKNLEIENFGEKKKKIPSV